MKVDKIAQLGERLDRWFDRSLPTFATQDHAAHGRAILRGVEIVRELDRLKAEGLAAIRAMLKSRAATTQQQRIASLIRAFELATKLGDTLHDELLDTDGENKLIRLKNEIAKALDSTDSGRTALAVLLDHPDEGVRASAGRYLLSMDLMPERVVPILREIEKDGKANSAGFKAHWALLDWELKQKSRLMDN